MNKSCNTCFAKKICDMFADFNGDKTPCMFYKNEGLVKEIPCVCHNCEYAKVLHTRRVGVLKVTWYCTRNWERPVPVEPDGFCSYGKSKEVSS